IYRTCERRHCPHTVKVMLLLGIGLRCHAHDADSRYHAFHLWAAHQSGMLNSMSHIHQHRALIVSAQPSCKGSIVYHLGFLDSPVMISCPLRYIACISAFDKSALAWDNATNASFT